MNIKSTLLICIISAVSFWNINGIHAEADSATSGYEKIYKDLAIERKDTSSIATDNQATVIDFITFVSNVEDDPDDLYDGQMIFTRGFTTYTKGNGKFTVTLRNGYDVDAADRLTDAMVSEINSSLGSNLTERDKMAAICEYITNTYTYDTNAKREIDNGNHGSGHDFVTAYYGDRKIICTDYAALTYILANKMGITCDLMEGNGHVYNIVKFSDTDSWIGYDLSGGTKYAQITPFDYLFNNNLYDTSGTSRACEIARAQNGDKTYKLAGVKELGTAFIYYGFKAHHIFEILISIAVIVSIIVITKGILPRKTRRSIKRRIARA